jgi:hypothetical protein
VRAVGLPGDAHRIPIRHSVGRQSRTTSSHVFSDLSFLSPLRALHYRSTLPKVADVANQPRTVSCRIAKIRSSPTVLDRHASSNGRVLAVENRLILTLASPNPMLVEAE